MSVQSMVVGALLGSIVLLSSTTGFAQTTCKLKYGGETLTGKACEEKLAYHCKTRGANIKGNTVYKEKCVAHFRKSMAAEPKCETFKKTVLDKLGSSSLPDYQRERERWLKTAEVYGTHATDENIEFAKQCETYGHIPSSTSYWIDKKRKQLKATWKEAVADLAKDSLQFQTMLKAAKRRSDSAIATIQMIDSELTQLDAIKKSNKLKLFQADISGVEKRHKRLSNMRKASMDALQKDLKKTKCPRVKNKKMSKKLAKLVKEHFSTGSHPKDVRKYVVTGKATKKRIAYKKITHEDIPGYACFKAKYEAKPEYKQCGYFSVSVRRTKIDGQKWGPYKDVFVGPVKYMSCKNIK